MCSANTLALPRGRGSPTRLGFASAVRSTPQAIVALQEKTVLAKVAQQAKELSSKASLVSGGGSLLGALGKYTSTFWRDLLSINGLAKAGGLYMVVCMLMNTIRNGTAEMEADELSKREESTNPIMASALRYTRNQRFWATSIGAVCTTAGLMTLLTVNPWIALPMLGGFMLCNHQLQQVLGFKNSAGENTKPLFVPAVYASKLEDTSSPHSSEPPLPPRSSPASPAQEAPLPSLGKGMPSPEEAKPNPMPGLTGQQVPPHLGAPAVQSPGGGSPSYAPPSNAPSVVNNYYGNPVFGGTFDNRVTHNGDSISPGASYNRGVPPYSSDESS